MFDSLRDAFRQAIHNFKTELHRDELPEAADRLLRAMRREILHAQESLGNAERELTGVRNRAAQEESSARTCLRREEMASRIGDGETARLAREFAGRHLRKHDILVRKAEILSQELEERSAEVAEMRRRFRNALTQRESLLAESGRTGARESLRHAESLFTEVDRMAERVRQMELTSDAELEVEDLQLDEATGSSPHRPPPDDLLDARLEELKRKVLEE